MNAEIKYPKTLMAAVTYFADLDRAHEFFVKIRWADGQVCCPRCGSVAVTYLANYRRWECKEKHAKRQFSVKVGTIMEDSALGLDKWAVAFWLEANAKNSISSYEIHRALGITQKSAWFMQHRIRLAMQSTDARKFGGGGNGTEVDEAFIGGLGKNMHHKRWLKVKGRGGMSSGKTAVVGLLERHTGKGKSRVRARVVQDINKATLHELVRTNIESHTEVFTDQHHGYYGLSNEFYHKIINHAEAYVRGNVHTNGLENFWSLFKRCIKGTHVNVEPFHLFRYVDAEAFRFNNREYNDSQRFVLALGGMDGKRLTYKALTGALEFHPTSPDKGEANESLPN